MLVEILQSMNVATLLIFVLVFFLSWKLFSWRNLPPGPWGYPIVGALASYDFRNISTFRNLWKKYGDLYTLSFGSNPFVMVNGYDTLKEIFVTNGDKTSDRPSCYNFDVLLAKSGK